MAGVNTYGISTDPGRLQLDAIHDYLTRSYWSPGVPRSVVARAHVAKGEEVTVIGAIGDREHVARLELEGAPGVSQVVPILKPYKLSSSQLRNGERSVFEISSGPIIFGSLPTSTRYATAPGTASQSPPTAARSSPRISAKGGVVALEPSIHLGAAGVAWVAEMFRD